MVAVCNTGFAAVSRPNRSTRWPPRTDPFYRVSGPGQWRWREGPSVRRVHDDLAPAVHRINRETMHDCCHVPVGTGTDPLAQEKELRAGKGGSWNSDPHGRQDRIGASPTSVGTGARHIESNICDLPALHFRLLMDREDVPALVSGQLRHDGNLVHHLKRVYRALGVLEIHARGATAYAARKPERVDRSPGSKPHQERCSRKSDKEVR